VVLFGGEINALPVCDVLVSRKNSCYLPFLIQYYIDNKVKVYLGCDQFNFIPEFSDLMILHDHLHLSDDHAGVG
jgi:hypothetical protein